MGTILKPEGAGLLVIGTNYRQAPVDFREKVAFVPDEMPGFLQRAHERLDRGDCFVISTCNRTEFYAVHSDLQAAAGRVRQLLLEYKAIDPTRDASHFYEYHGRGAVEQLFRVASGIDSQMVGEPQILQQVKNAHDMSLKANTLGVVGEHMLDAAIRCGRRARAETQISAGAVSVAFAAVSLAHKVFGDLTARTALVLGSGQTGGLVAKHLREHGIGRMLLVNRSIERARALAAEMRGEAMELERLGEALVHADIVITSTSAPGHLVDERTLRGAMRARQNKTLLIVDIGVPRDVDPAVGKVDNVFLHNTDGLHVMIDQTLQRRRREVPKVERVIVEEVDRFFDWYKGLQAAPVIKELRGRMEALRLAEIEHQTRHLNPEQRAAVEQVTRSLLNKILHRPTKLLRDAAADGEVGLRRIEAARDLFGLDENLRDDAPKE
jgi:glutamyl-tRNA reductase